jgi:uncharacterized MAPEG superfamily protein
MLQEYMLSFLGLWLIIMTIMVQQFIAVLAHRKQKTFVPGKLSEKLGHESFVFRSNRTFMNSQENIVQFIVPAVMAMFLGVFNITLAIIVWVYAIARIGHMVAYYKDTRTTNPTPKSYFFLLGFVANLVLMVALLIQIFTM